MFRNSSRVCQFAAVALVLSLPHMALSAQRHSGYARTLYDLREARQLLQRTSETQPSNDSLDEVNIAIGHIESAIAEINDGSVDGDANRNDALRVNPHMLWAARLSKSLDLLAKAQRECGKEKEISDSNGLQARILGQIGQAQSRLKVAVETVNFDYRARSMSTRND